MYKSALSPRVLLNSGVLLLGAIIAHAIGCGTFVPLLPFALISIVLIALLTLLSLGELEGPSLALLIVVAQAGTHFLLGGGQMRMLIPVCGGPARYMTMMMGSMMSPTIMISSHTLLGIASYVFISKSENFWNFARYFLLSIFVPTFHPSSTRKIGLLSQTKLELTVIVTRLQSFLTEAATRLSAPPAYPVIN